MRKLSIFLALICITLASCGKVQQEPVQHIDIVEPIMLETTEAEEVPESEAVSETEILPETEETVSETETLPESGDAEASANVAVRVDGVYTSAADVAAYLNEYGRLPENFITKKQAEKLGWEGGSLEPYAPGKCIGGDHFGNYEGLLPEKEGREYRECDIDTLGKKKRGAKRIIYSNDGLIYYTGDHYATFTLLYGQE